MKTEAAGPLESAADQASPAGENCPPALVFKRLGLQQRRQLARS
jgi:hypothetical protein